jgi:radical SAM protein with 4Fe4S-binding SPASM domain
VGNPSLKKDLVIKIASKIKEYPNIFGDILTNGTLFDEEFVKKIIEIRWNEITISINSSSESLDDFLKGMKGAHAKILNGLKLFDIWKKKLNCSFPKLAFHIVITKYNFNDICNVVKLAALYNVKKVDVFLVNDRLGRPGSFCIPPEKYDEFIDELKRAENIAISNNIEFTRQFTDENLKKYLNLSPEMHVTNHFKTMQMDVEPMSKVFDERKKCNLLSNALCVIPFNQLVINATGYAYVCPLSFPKYEVMEIIDDKNALEIWYGEKFNRLRALLLYSFPPECSDCDLTMIHKSQVIRERGNENQPH